MSFRLKQQKMNVKKLLSQKKKIEKNISQLHPDNPLATAMRQRYREINEQLNLANMSP